MRLVANSTTLFRRLLTRDVVQVHTYATSNISSDLNVSTFSQYGN